MKSVASLAIVTALGAAPLLADFSYQETSTITGGAMLSMLKVVGVFSKQAREPIVANVSVKGDRMVHKTATHASIIDLSSQTITSVDFQKKQYSVMTFDEMKQALEQMQQKMKEKQKDAPDLQFKVSANATGKSKDVAGYAAKEMILKMEMEGTDQKSGQKGGMNITSDMWIASGISGYKEVRDFYKRMAEKLNWTPGGNLFMQNPDVAKGMAEVYKEVSKLDGVPVEQLITMGASGQPTDGSAPAAAPQQPPQQQTQQAPPTSVGSALGGALGGRFGLGRKKTSTDQQQQQQPASNGSAPSGNPGSLLEMTTVAGGFSTASVDDSLFAVPSGFKKVEADMKKIH